LVAHRQRPELVQAHVHLVGDVAEVAPAAGGAAIVHLETLDDAVGIHLNRLGVLATDVQHGAGFGKHGMGPEAVTEDLGANLLLGAGQGARRSRADHVGLLSAVSARPGSARGWRLHGRRFPACLNVRSSAHQLVVMASA
jgi:hypothetical protein